MTSYDKHGKNILLIVANLHYIHFALLSPKRLREENVQLIVFVVYSWLNLAKTSSRMNCMAVSFPRETEKGKEKREVTHYLPTLKLTIVTITSRSF